MSNKPTLVSRQILVSFILVTSLFALWGFANDITNPMVRAFSKVLLMNNFQGSLIQFAFYGGYFAMAFVAAYFIKRFGYKSGIVIGLALYASGAFLFYPSSLGTSFWPFLVSYFILTCGLSFLETSANPYILSMGDAETATQRLNLSQSFNPIGSLIGMFTAQQLILARLNEAPFEERFALREADPQIFYALQAHDLKVIRDPYVAIGAVVLVMMIVFLLVKMPKVKADSQPLNVKATFQRLLSNASYREGVVAQFFYVGVQIMCWTFIIHYAEMELGISNQVAQLYNIAAMCIFCCSRFVCTYLLRFVNAGKLLQILALCGVMLVCGVVFVKGIFGLYCLVAISACMSLMFPTIYGLALKNVGHDTEFGAAGLIMSIVGGSILPPLQALMIDQPTICGLSGVRFSFVLPFVCFVVIAVYGYRSHKIFS